LNQECYTCGMSVSPTLTSFTKEGEPSHFEGIFRQYHSNLCNLAYNLVHDTDAAKDIVQEVFFKLWKNRDKIDMGEQIKNYLFKATTHTALNHLRHNKRLIRIEQDTSIKDTFQAPSHTEEAGFKELELRLRDAIDTLPPKCKTIYLLSRHEGLKHPQIAEALGLSVKTVENQMTIALQKLRERLKPFLTIEFLIIAILLGLLALSR
jgi:RNA polymerase sigma-70 factor, ECF subfamily